MADKLSEEELLIKQLEQTANRNERLMKIEESVTKLKDEIESEIDQFKKTISDKLQNHNPRNS